MTRAKSAQKKRRDKNQLRRAEEKQPFLEHVYELRRRLFYIIVSVSIFGSAAYGIEHKIVDALLRPARHQEFIYTTPGGGLDFLFRLCIYVGIACSIPVIVYQILRYLEPLLQFNTRRIVAIGSIASGILAIAGMTFGYFIGLPAAMHFLMHQFVTPQIQPLLTIQSYMSFVLVYMLGSALLLQVPLILLIINRIKPLQPKKLLSLKYERWVIVIGFVGGALMNPNPNLMAQLIVIGPIIVAYQVGVLLVWFANRGTKRAPQVQNLINNDSQVQAARRNATARRAGIEPVFTHLPVKPAPAPFKTGPARTTAPAATRSMKASVKAYSDIRPVNNVRPANQPLNTAHKPTPKTTPAPLRPGRPRSYVDGFMPRRSVYQSGTTGLISPDSASA